MFSASANAQIEGLSSWDICLDPGHSQKENMGVFGYSEAERNVCVALRLKEMLLNETDIDTVFITRTNDQQKVSLSQRTDYANSRNNYAGSDWFHSIHSDAGAASANSTLLLWGQYQNGNEKIPNGGQRMADFMIGNLTNGMRTYTIRGSIGDCTFYGCDFGGPYLFVNRNTIMPSELSESGFHTNPRQNQLFMNDDWKRLEARTFFWSILEFHDIANPPVKIVTGIISDADSKVPVNGAFVKVNNDQTYITDTYESLFYKYTTDPDLLHNGFYYFENVEGDSAKIVVEADGYYSDSVTVAFVENFFTFNDFELISKTPPFVTTTTPIDGDTNVEALNDIFISFSRVMNRQSVESALKIEPDIFGEIFWQNNDTRIKIKSDSLKFLTNYKITISGYAQDLYGHQLDGNGDGVSGDDFVLNFRTGADYYAPELISSIPRLNSENIELKPIITLTYDELIDSLSITPDIFKLERFTDKVAIPGILEHYPLKDRSVLSFFPADKLDADELFVTRIYPGLRDIYGNEVSVLKSIPFNTGTQDWDITIIDNFETNLTSNWRQPTESGSTTGYDPVPGIFRDENIEIINRLYSGSKSMEIFYDWDLDADSWLIRIYLSQGIPRGVQFDTTSYLQAYIFGDGSGNKFRFCVDEGDGSSWLGHEVSEWIEIDWFGWQLVEWQMSDPDLVGDWIGNGVLDGSSYRIDSFQFTHQHGASKNGTIYIDDLQLVKKSDLSGMERTAVNKVPQSFKLMQNYPNPFNPETIIRFNLAEYGFTRLEVFNSLGELIETLIAKNLPAGVHVVKFNSLNLASGIYIYRLSSGNNIQTKKMVLVR